MKAAVLHGKDDIRYEEIEDLKVESGKIKVNVKACGICRSDIPRVLNGTAHYFPIILGHEFSGIVTEVGDNTSKFKVGDHVAGVPLIPCYECDDCKNGNFSLCKHYSFIGSREPGAYAEYIVVPENNLVKIDDAISFEQGALFEPSTVALHALKLVNYNKEKAKNVAILGFGTIGSFALQWAKILGASNIVVFGIDDERLELAKEFGATHVINTKKENFLEDAMNITNNKGYDYIFETAGVTDTMKYSFHLAANKADICFIGTPTKDITFTWKEWELMNRKEFNLTGSWMSYSFPFPGDEWTMTAECFANGKLKYDPNILYKTFALKDVKDAFELFKIPGKVEGRIVLKND